MIEVVNPETCTACNICVRVCPTNVFDPVPNGAPVIARQSDCQTCFMCELYCPEDALYVSPYAELRDESIAAAGLGQRLGSYRRAVGWAKESRHARFLDESFKLLGG